MASRAGRVGVMPKPKLRVASSHLRLRGRRSCNSLFPKIFITAVQLLPGLPVIKNSAASERHCEPTTAALTTLAKIPTEVRWPSLFGHSAKHARPGTPPPKTGAGAGVRTSAHPPLGYRPVGRVPAVCSRKSLKPPKGGEGGREKSAFEPRASAANAGSCSYSHTCATQQLLR